MDWRQVWNEDVDTHRQKLPGSPADQNNINNNEENNLCQFECQIMTKKNKQIVFYPKDIHGNKPPGAVGSPQHRMIVYLLCYDRYDRFNKYLSVIFLEKECLAPRLE
jgi:hypothetical protein